MMKSGKILFPLLFCVAANVCHSSDIIPDDHLTTWNPGLNAVGGIPNRTTIFQTIQAATYANGANDASAGIQTALDACPAGQVVLLSSGKFTVNNLLLIHSSITLRGAGPGVTVLTKTNGAKPRTSPLQPVDPGSYTYDQQPIVIIGPSRWPGPDSTTSQNLTVDGAKGATSLTISNATGFAAGQFVLLDEKSGASWQPTPAGFPQGAKVWQGDRVSWNMHLPVQQYQDDCTYSNATGPYDTTPGVPPDAMSWFCRTDRPTCEIKEIASVSGNTISFTTPLHISYRTSHAAQLTRYSDFSGTLSDRASAQIKNAGIENLTVIGGADGQIRFEDAAYCWANNIENTQWLGEGFAVDGSFRIEIRHSNIHDGSWPQPGGAGYAISFADGSSEILVEDNISINTCKNMVVRSCGAGSVFGYNYTDDAWDFDAPTWVECGLNASHMAGPHHVLFEGNYGVNFDSDYTHGNAIYMTCLRNWMSGHRFVFASGFSDAGNIRCIGAAYGSWWDSFVGNVLGRPSQMSGWNYDDPAMTGNNSNWTDPTVWRLGYDPERWSMVPDPMTLSTAIRHGNYDYLNDAQIFDPTIADHTIPNSLYLTGKPAFFGSLTWPWVQPENPAQQIFTLPAMQRFGTAPVIASALTASGTVGAAFTYQIAATNSPTGYNATPLPAGLTVNTSTGVISGTPTAVGTTSVTISATNSSGTGTATLSLTINSAAPPVITSALSASGTVGKAFSYQIGATNTPTSFHATPLPAGLTVNTSTGVISGTPTTAGTTSVTISATNAYGTGSATLSLTVTTPPPPPPWAFVQGNAGNSAASSNALAFSSATTAGNLMIVHVDWSNTSNFTSIKDSQGNVFTQVGTEQNATGFGIKSRLYYSKNIKGGADTVTSTVSGTPASHELYIHEYSGLDPVNPLDGFSVNLSSGATFTSNNVVTTATNDLLFGTEVDAGAATAATGWTVRSTFDSNVTADKNAPTAGSYAFTGNSSGAGIAWIAAFKHTTGGNTPPAITSGPTATPNPATVGQSVAFKVTASDPDGDALSYAWTFGDNGTGTGASPSHTFAAAGTYTAKVTVTDTAGLTATSSVSVTVNATAAAPAITSPLTATGTVGAAFTYAITATNSPTSYNATPLPAGLTVNTSTGAITGTPTAAGTTSVTISASNATGTGSATLSVTINPAAIAPVAYWKFDDGSGASAVDSSGNGNTGTLVNAPTWASGEVNGALAFNGSSQYVTVPAAAGSSLDIDSPPVTIAAWVNPNTISAPQTIFLRGLSNGVGAGKQGYGLFINSNGKVNVGSAGGGNFDSLTTLTAKTWQHVAAVINGSASKVYINGVDQTPAGVKVNVVASSAGLTIGAARNSANTAFGRFFNGTLDEVQVYGAALSPDQIAVLAGVSAPTTALAYSTAALPMTVTHVKASVSLKSPDKDQCTISGTISGLPAGLALNGQNAALNIGSAEASFTLDSKGKAHSANASLSMKLTKGKLSFSGKLKGGLAEAWSVNSSGVLMLPVSLQLGSGIYSANVKVAVRVSK
jgi:PKD repeat protein